MFDWLKKKSKTIIYDRREYERNTYHLFIQYIKISYFLVRVIKTKTYAVL